MAPTDSVNFEALQILLKASSREQVVALCQQASTLGQAKSVPTQTVAQQIFPADFHQNLKSLLVGVLAEHLSQWKTQAINSQVSLPQLVDFDWRVDMKTSADSVSHMSAATCLLQLKVQNVPKQVDRVPPVDVVNVELSKETLDTMLDGLGKIRDQLSSVAAKP
ncbi:COMMD9 [Branchiostoma lanceolatum]|uniref:COMMD9 protein n=1 Tax=Branchiostoma lanceolatum TaxID=7740 RepID=A0A8K0ENC0_BRALA|nr:COMMD9 [Branchiostoma lanceolatum]